MSEKSFKEKIKERIELKKQEARSKSQSSLSQDSPVPKINLDFLKEEAEIQNSLDKISTSHSDQSYKNLQNEILFFTEGVFETNSDEGEEEDNLEETESNQKDSPTHLASSYLQADDFSAVEKFVKNKISYDDDELLYFPETKQSGFISERSSRSLTEEGLYVPEKPKVSSRNKSLLQNRFIEDNSTDWFNSLGELEQFQSYFYNNMICRTERYQKIVPIFIPPTQMSSNYLFENKIIQIQIKDIAFDHHSLFNEENVIAKKLEIFYENYLERNKINVVEKIGEKICVLRQVLKDTQSREEPTDDKIIKIKKYKNEIRDLRNKLHREENTNQNLLKNILKQWKYLKEIREYQKFQATNLKIKIIRKDYDLDEDQRIWDERFDLEFNEIVDDAFSFYYEEKQRIKRNRSDDIEMHPRIKKPNVDEIKVQLNDIFLNSLRHPGDPQIFVELSKIDISNKIINDNREIKRKNQILETRYFIKIIFDEFTVTSKKGSYLNLNFQVHLDALFTIKLTRKIPEKIKIQIFEENKFKIDRKIVSIYIPVPSDREIFTESQYEKISFTSSKNYERDFGVGSGRFFKDKTGKIEYTSGGINIKTGWSTITEIDQRSERKTKNTGVTKEKIKKWHDDHILDPLDPDSNFLMNVIQSKTEPKKTDEKNLFRLNEDLTAFCSIEELNQNPRLNALIARFRNDLQYKDMKLIPQLECEIEIPERKNLIDEIIGLDMIDEQRHNGKKYLKQVYEAITVYSKMINRDNENWNILIGDEVPTFASIIEGFLGIFGPKRPLKPTRRLRTARATQRINDIKNINILVNVVRAFSIPTRNDDPIQNARKNSNLSMTQQSYRLSNVRPYVGISVRDKYCRTVTAEGSNPSWNEQLVINLSHKPDKIRGNLTIQLFDEYNEDILEDDRSRTSEIYQRITSKWLGELRIPMSTIYSNPRIDGIFEINTPPIMLGYSQPTLNTPESTSMYLGNLPEISGPTYVSLFISLEPYVEHDYFTTNGLECTELNATKTFIDLWFDELRLEFPTRSQDPYITLLNGKRVCLTRLIGGIDIPFELSEHSEFMIRRFVSLIPVYQSHDQCTQLNGVWLNNSQILNFLCASPKDLGVLLTCFYTSLGIESWLILGHGLTSGSTCFVLIREENDYFIVDPLTGRKYSSKDTYCSLVKVYCLVNENNVWANIQRENRVYLTQFNLKNSADWKPLFKTSFPAPVGFIHEVNFEYKNSLETEKLRKNIELRIMRKIIQWRLRDHRKTIWNRFIGDKLKGILIDLERDACFEYTSENSIEKLKIILAPFKVNGFPLNMPYTNLTNILERIKTTEIHLNSQKDVEFALGVYIHDYGCNVFSIWIFLISLVSSIVYID